MEVVGYSFDADVSCIDCTFDYAKRRYIEFIENKIEDYGNLIFDRIVSYKSADIVDWSQWDFLEEGLKDFLADYFKESDLDELLNHVTDCEGNQIHPIFSDDELIDDDEVCCGHGRNPIVIKLANYFTKEYTIEIMDGVQPLVIDHNDKTILLGLDERAKRMSQHENFKETFDEAIDYMINSYFGYTDYTIKEYSHPYGSFVTTENTDYAWLIEPKNVFEL